MMWVGDGALAVKPKNKPSEVGVGAWWRFVASKDCGDEIIERFICFQKFVFIYSVTEGF